VRRASWAAAAIAAVALAAGCGSGSGSGSSGSKPTLTVSAASSLKNAFQRCAQVFDAANVRFSFAGSDELAAQIRQGARPDVYAAANTKLPDALHAAGLLGAPVVFAGNRLVIAVPTESKINSLADLTKPGTKVVVGAKGVAVGDYTTAVLARLPPARRRAILAGVRSREPDVFGIVGKLTQGAADAGFVYITDVVGSKGALRAVELPPALQPRVEYGIGVVRGTKHEAQSKAFVDSLTSGPCREAMKQAGFEPPPG
jgi:molybdate transport system substrate-binding protein